jgi:hypothetical protein
LSLAEKRLGERLEDPKCYEIQFGGRQALPPWEGKNYVLKPMMKTSGSIPVKGRGVDMTVQVPILQPERWQQLELEALPAPPITVTQTGQKEFTALYADETRPYKVKFIRGDEGEEHVVNLLPLCENQIIRIREAFGRDMVLDETRQSNMDTIFLKSADSSPPDRTFERILKYTLGDDLTEHGVRIHKGNTTAQIREGIKKLHPGINPAKMMFEGAEMAGEDDVTG